MSLGERGGISPREAGVAVEQLEQQPRLHPLQALTIETNYVQSFFNGALERSKVELPWLMQKEATRCHREGVSQPLSEKAVRQRYMFGLYDAYVALKADEKGINLNPNSSLNSTKQRSAVDRFKDQWGDMSYHLLDTVKGITQELDETREEQLAHPETIEPYDLHLAKRRAKRFRATLPREFRDLFTEQSGISHDNLPKKVGQSISTLLLSGASAYGVDAAALGSGSAGVALTAELAEKYLGGKGIAAAAVASYGFLAWGIGKNIVANMRLNKELGVNTNLGFAAGDVAAQVKGAGEKTADRLGALGQAGGEIAKEVPWWVGLGSAKSVGWLNWHEVGLFVFWANMGGTAYSVAEAKAIHKFLDWRRRSYNRRHPFMEPIDQDFGESQEQVAHPNTEVKIDDTALFENGSINRDNQDDVSTDRGI